MNFVRRWRSCSFFPADRYRRGEKKYIFSPRRGRMKSVDQEGNGRWKIRSRRCILMLLNDLPCKRFFHLCNISLIFSFFFLILLAALLLGCFSFPSLLLASSFLENMPTLCFLLRDFFFFWNRKSCGFFFFFFFFNLKLAKNFPPFFFVPLRGSYVIEITRSARLEIRGCTWCVW